MRCKKPARTLIGRRKPEDIRDLIENSHRVQTTFGNTSGVGNVLSKSNLKALGKTVQLELNHGRKTLNESNSTEEFHKITLVRNFAMMLQRSFPQHKEVIAVLLEAWDGGECKNAKVAIEMIDELVDLIVYGKAVSAQF